MGPRRQSTRLLNRAVRGAALIAAVLIVVEAAAPTAAAVAQTLRDRPRAHVRELAAGRFLVAARHLPDPNFSETVVLLADYSADNAMGLIINRQSAVPLSRIFTDLIEAHGRSEPAYVGGPVSQTGALALHRARYSVPDSKRIFADVHLISTRAGLEQLVASGARPNTFRVYLGYSGWGTGQLDQETAVGAWHVLWGDPDVVFDPEPETVWQRQLQRTERLIVWLRAPGPWLAA